MSVSPSTIVDYLRTDAGRPLGAKALARGLEISKEEYPEFRDQLKQLEDQGVLYEVKGGRYAVPDKINLVVGRLQTIKSGAGFVIPDDGTGDLFIPSHALGSAVDGDRVVGRIEHHRRDKRPEGSIIKVLKRARETMVGVYTPARNFGFVAPENKKLNKDVFVPPGQEAGAVENDVVVVRVTSWGDEHHGPAGEVEQVLGPMDDPGVDVLAVIHGHELPVEFPAAVEREAEELRGRAEVSAAELERREDLRDHWTFTIDPADAKDHDDALSVRSVPDGLWEVGIHIADVGHFVREGSAIDREALARGTSVYLVDRVIPMLPETLSSELCSLRPREDRFALSLLLTLDGDGDVHGGRLVRSVIRSRHRLSYEEAQEVLDGEGSVDDRTDEAIQRLVGMSRGLRRKREERGSLDFDTPEARVVLNPEGEPTDIQRVPRLEAHRLIEDFMLLANASIAQRAMREEVPFLYRIHERPDTERLEQLAEFAATFGYRLSRRSDTEVQPTDLQRLLSKVKGRTEEDLVSTVVLRSMKQARYSEENAGHFGLALEDYTHFTSPIRRYSDLVVHRLAARLWIDGEPVPRQTARETLPEVARITSERERVAVDAERDSVDLKKVEFMERHLREEFDGAVSGVTSFGFFVMLDAFFVEGLVHISSLEDDYYVYLEEQYALVGERTRRRFQLGDRVRVRVAAVNREERKIDFAILGEAS